MDWVKLGRGLRALRMRRGWRQADLALVARCSQSLISRVERGRGGLASGRTLQAISSALEARLVVRLDWNGEALDRLLDRGHAQLVEHVIRVLRAAGWEAVPEATFALGGERGSVDILAWHAPRQPFSSSRSSRWFHMSRRWSRRSTGRSGSVERSPALGAGTRRPSRGSWSSPTSERAGVASWAHPTLFEAAFPDRNVAVRRFIQWPGERGLNALWFVSASNQVHARHRVAGRGPAACSVDVPSRLSPCQRVAWVIADRIRLTNSRPSAGWHETWAASRPAAAPVPVPERRGRQRACIIRVRA